jgi:hypothetical protein
MDTFASNSKLQPVGALFGLGCDLYTGGGQGGQQVCFTCGISDLSEFKMIGSCTQPGVCYKHVYINPVGCTLIRRNWTRLLEEDVFFTQPYCPNPIYTTLQGKSRWCRMFQAYLSFDHVSIYSCLCRFPPCVPRGRVVGEWMEWKHNAH